MFDIDNSTKMNILRIIQEFSRTPANIQGQQDLFSRIKDKAGFDSKFKDNSWRSRTFGNLSIASRICLTSPSWGILDTWPNQHS